MHIRFSSKRRVGPLTVAAVAAIAVFAMLAAESAPATAASGAGASKRARRCAGSQLVIWLNQVPGSGAAGSVFHRLGFTNLSRRTCTLRGYPRVTAANLHGGKIGGSALREAAGTPHTVRLHPGDTAFATLRITEAQNFPHSVCHPVTAAGLRVSPPGQHSHKLVPFPFEACAVNTNLSVRAVKG